MSNSRITAQQVAAAAGVSQSAVSRVFTPGASASPRTIAKVQQAAMELGYRPNSLARAMVSGKSRMIGLVVAYLQNQFYPDAMERLSNQLQERGYHLLVFLSAQTESNIDTVVSEILGYQVDGIIAASVAMSSDLSERCRQAGVPLVLFNRSQNDPAMSSVTSDNRAGGKQVADFLLAGGHQRIAYIAGWEGASTQRDREAGFVEALQAGGQNLYARAVGNFNLDEAAAAARQLFDVPKADLPDAVFVANDHMAFKVMDVLRFDLGLAIPEDVSVVGYDDVPAASWQAYDLTTLRQPANQMVTETVRLLLAQIEEENHAPSQVEIGGPLILRGSARLPKGWKT